MSSAPTPDHDITGIHAHYLSQQIADLRSDVREVKQEVRDTNAHITTLLIAGLVAAAGVIGTLVAGFITVLQRL